MSAVDEIAVETKTHIDESVSLLTSDINVPEVPEESNHEFKESVGPINDLLQHQPNGSMNRPLIRYTKEQLLALRESPLVKVPETLQSTIGFAEIAKKEVKKSTTDGTTDNDKSKTSNGNFGDNMNKSKDDTNTLGISKSPLLTVQKSPGSSAPTSPKPSDKIVLGPPKMAFASSIGGLKSIEDKSVALTRSGRADNLRQRQGEEAASYLRAGGGKDFEPRAPRGPTGGRGFIGREALKEKSMVERSTRDIKDSKEKETISPSSNGVHHSRITVPHRSQDQSRNIRREGGVTNVKEHLGRTNSRHHPHGEERSETPEWMNYNPEEENKKGKEGEEDKKGFDFQAWRLRMKEQDRNKEKIRTDKESKETNEKGRARSVSRADISISWRAENKPGVLEEELATPMVESKENPTKENQPSGYNEPPINKIPNVDQLFAPGGIGLSDIESTSSDAFDKFLSQHKLAMAEENPPINSDGPAETDALGNVGSGGRKNEFGREQATSRFAKFFTPNSEDNTPDMNRKENTKVYSITPQNHNLASEAIPPGHITLDTLFQSQPAAVTTNGPAASSHTKANEKKRMLSEAEVLRSLGAKPPSKSDLNERNPEDIMGFNKILAALAKGNVPDTQRSSQQNISTSTNQAPPTDSSAIAPHIGLPFHDPSIIIAQKPHSNPKVPPPQSRFDPMNRSLGIADLTASDSARKLNMLFGGNVPTSVYRQLSTRPDGNSRESSTNSSPALKFNTTKAMLSNFSHSQNIPQTANLQDHLPIYKSPPRPRSPVLHHQGLNHSHFHNMISPYSNGPNIHQHSHTHHDFPPPLPLGRNIPVEQLFGMLPPRNPTPQQIHPQYQQTQINVNIPPQVPFNYQHQPDRYQQQTPFSGNHIPQQFPVHPHPPIIPPVTEALFANMHGYAQFIPNLVNNAISPNSITGIPPNSNLQQRSMMTLEEIERRGLGGR